MNVTITYSRLRWEHIDRTIKVDTPAEAMEKARTMVAAVEDADWDIGRVEGGMEIDLRDAEGRQIGFKTRDEPG